MRRKSARRYWPYLSASPCCPSFFFNDTPTTEIYTLSLHDALPIWEDCGLLTGAERQNTVRRVVERLIELVAHPEVECEIRLNFPVVLRVEVVREGPVLSYPGARSEEHTSELQSQSNLVCRLLLEKK